MVEKAYVMGSTPLESDTGRLASVATEEAFDQDRGWQQRLLPLMAGMIVALTILFFVVTLAQLAFLQASILQSPPIELDQTLSEALRGHDVTFDELYRLRQFEVLVAMERYTAEKRYHQAGVLLMSGLWLRYLGFFTGMILALIGASFILGKLRESRQELEGRFAQIGVTLRTASPGIILAALGVILMVVALMDRDSYNVTDANIYLRESVISAEAFANSNGSRAPAEKPGDELPDLP